MNSQMFLNIPRNLVLVTVKELTAKTGVTDRTLRRWRKLYGLQVRGFTGNMPLFSLREVEAMEKARLKRMERQRRANAKRGAKR